MSSDSCAYSGCPECYQDVDLGSKCPECYCEAMIMVPRMCEHCNGEGVTGGYGCDDHGIQCDQCDKGFVVEPRK